jgi:hypothetical protein
MPKEHERMSAQIFARQARIGRVVALKSTAGDETQVRYRENNRLEHPPVGVIERTVYEDAIGRRRCEHRVGV